MVLPESLRAVQASWGLNDGLVPHLERLIAADMDDLQSRTRLRLIRVCKGFCPRDTACEFAILLCCLMCVEPLLYDILGGASIHTNDNIGRHVQQFLVSDIARATAYVG